MDRRRFLTAMGIVALLPGTVAGQVVVVPPWYENERRRRDYERWRAREWRRRERAARRRREQWRREQWQEEREREEWARRQRWYRP